MTASISLSDVQDLLASWWYDYDEANIEHWPNYFTAGIRYRSGSDTGESSYEDVVRADHHGRESLIEGFGSSRRKGIYPIRHICSNLHLRAERASEADFRGYMLVTRVAGEQAVPIATGRCTGTVSNAEGRLKISEMKLVFDLSDSKPIETISRRPM